MALLKGIRRRAQGSERRAEIEERSLTNRVRKSRESGDEIPR